MQTCVFVFVRVCVCMYIYVCVCVCVFMYVLASKDSRNSLISNTELLDCQGIVHFEGICESKTVNKEM